MIKISKDEAEMLREKGRGFDVHMSSRTHKARAKKYYLTENPKSIQILEKYRKNKVAK